MASKRKQSPRKAPDEWRAINRSAKVKDGRPVLLLVPDPRKDGDVLVVEGYWCTATQAWWLANCAAGLPGCDPVRDVYGAPTMWRPMPAPPEQHQAQKKRSTKAKNPARSTAVLVPAQAAHKPAIAAARVMPALMSDAAAALRKAISARPHVG